jgi:hypothetical protein
MAIYPILINGMNRNQSLYLPEADSEDEAIAKTLKQAKIDFDFIESVESRNLDQLGRVLAAHNDKDSIRPAQKNVIQVDGIDWDLLNQQKKTLLNVIDPQKGMNLNAISGIISMIDAMQDKAEEKGLWKFPEEKE